MNINIPKYFNLTIKDSVFTPGFIYSNLLAFKPFVASNLHWGRGDISSLGLSVLCILMLNTECIYNHSWQVAMAHDVKVPSFLSYTIRSVSPLIKGQNHFKVGSEYTFIKLQQNVSSLANKLDIAVCPASGVFTDSSTVANTRRHLVSTLRLLASSPDERVFSERCFQIISGLSPFLYKSEPVSYATLLEQRVSTTGDAPFGPRKIFKIDNDLVYGYTGGVPSLKAFYLYRLLFDDTSVSFCGKVLKLSAPTAESGVCIFGPSDESTLLITIFSDSVEPPTLHDDSGVLPNRDKVFGKQKKASKPNSNGFHSSSQAPQYSVRYADGTVITVKKLSDFLTVVEAIAKSASGNGHA
jgi:hypothetical protein